VLTAIEKRTALSEGKPIPPFQREGRLRAVAKRRKTLRGGAFERPRARASSGVKAQAQAGAAAAPLRGLRVP